MHLRLTAFLLVSLASITGALAQAYVGIGADFGAIARRGVWAETYGPALVTGFRIEGATKAGWLGNLQGELLYGSDVRIDPIASLRTERGVLGDDVDAAAPVVISLRARGFRCAALAGYQGRFAESAIGWRVLAGPSYTRHNIRIQDDANLTTSNLSEGVKAGYDRRAGGFGAYGEAGVTLANDDGSFVAFVTGTVNAFAAKPLRSVQFDLRRQAPAAGTDTALGVKAGFVTALFRPTSLREAEDIYY